MTLGERRPDPRWTELFLLIGDLADRDRLEERWSGRLPAVAASPREDVALVFDTFDIDEAILMGANRLSLSTAQFNELVRFRDALNAFLDSVSDEDWGHMDYKDVLASPRWLAVSDAARRFAGLPPGT